MEIGNVFWYGMLGQSFTLIPNTYSQYFEILIGTLKNEDNLKNEDDLKKKKITFLVCAQYFEPNEPKC